MTDTATRVEPDVRREVPPPDQSRPEDLRPVPGRSRLTWAISDAHVLAVRHLRQIPRVPELLVFSIIQPVMFVLLFVYVFGGAIDVPGGSYVDFLMPGVFVQTVAFGAMTTGVGLADDLHKGLIDRFRSLPMARSAVLTGRTLSDLARNAMTVLIMLVVGFAVGFRLHTTVPAFLGGVGLLMLFSYGFSWISATIGLLVRSVEAAQSGGFIWLFPLTFASSAFVPLTTLPGWLQAFARHSPVTVTVDALRGLFLGGPVTWAALQSLAWVLGILAVFVPLSVHRYRQTTAS